MDLDDFLYDDERDDDRDDDFLSFCSNEMDMEQSLIKENSIHNAFSVERDYINSKAYHDKFEKLPINRNVQQSLYQQVGRLLNEVNGKEEEKLFAINARTGDFIVDNFKRPGRSSKTSFNNEEFKLIYDCKDSIILVHNHSFNSRPSIQDLLTFLNEDKIRLSIIACHDGTLYGIYDVNPKLEKIYESCYNKFKDIACNEDEAKKLATTEIYKINNKLGNRHKLFKMEEL